MKETIDKFRKLFSSEIFNRASNAFLRKNGFIPYAVEDSCLHLIVTVNSNFQEIENLKKVYSCDLVSDTKVDEKTFDEIFAFCIESHNNEKIENTKERDEIKESQKIDSSTTSTNFKIDHSKFKIIYVIAAIIVIIIIILFSNIQSEQLKSQREKLHKQRINQIAQLEKDIQIIDNRISGILLLKGKYKDSIESKFKSKRELLILKLKVLYKIEQEYQISK